MKRGRIISGGISCRRYRDGRLFISLNWNRERFALLFAFAGPPFTHQQMPLKMVYFGQTSCEHDTERYLDVVKYVFSSYKKEVPLVINTMGWVKGKQGGVFCRGAAAPADGRFLERVEPEDRACRPRAGAGLCSSVLAGCAAAAAVCSPLPQGRGCCC